MPSLSHAELDLHETQNVDQKPSMKRAEPDLPKKQNVDYENENVEQGQR